MTMIQVMINDVIICSEIMSHWDPYAMHRGGCLELYYCNIVEWSWWDSSPTGFLQCFDTVGLVI